MFASNGEAAKATLVAIVCGLVGAVALAQTNAPVKGETVISSSPAIQPSLGPLAGTAPTPSAVPFTRPSDTIGEAADKQRMTRMLQMQSKSTASGSAPAGAPIGAPIAVVPAIQASSPPPNVVPFKPSKPPEPEMVLTELLSAPGVAYATINVLGMDRRVALGDELGNGWKVTAVDRFSVELTSVRTGESTQAEKSRNTKQSGKSKKQNVVPKTMTLVLRSPQDAVPLQMNSLNPNVR